MSGSPSAPVSDGFYYASGEVYSLCFDQSGQQIAFQTIQPGTAATRCSLGVDFSSGRTKYRLVMTPKTAGTGWAMVSCNSGSSSDGCTSWTIVPNTTSDNPTVAYLYRFAKSGLVYIGAYYNTYRIDMTNP